MKLSHFIVSWSFIYAVFGVGLYAFPFKFMSIYGINLDPDGGELMANVLGSTLISFAVVLFWVRNVPLTERLQRIILISNFVYVVFDTPVAVRNLVDGTMDAGGWIPVMVHFYLGLTMAYFLFIKKEQPQAA
ncbi:MAG: hypothetical protein MUF42_10250 [Cytophagaceae bacterium]|jgi:hypothetical protein|nr:hypothetical protein [Cytophagaceae bacterium]